MKWLELCLTWRRVALHSLSSDLLQRPGGAARRVFRRRAFGGRGSLRCGRAQGVPRGTEEGTSPGKGLTCPGLHSTHRPFPTLQGIQLPT